MTDIPALDKLLKYKLINEEDLQKRIRELAAIINEDYAGEELLLICILRGGVMFMTDLMRHLDVPNAIDFMSVSSYGVGARESSGTVRITLDLRTDIKDKNVILVEDIVDSGNTVKSVVDMLEMRGPKSVKICSLLDKIERRTADVKIDYIGFQIPDEFVFGYGLDIDEYYRNLPYIGVANPDVFIIPE
jgi:hypoxanthine phosphoribosyltransferase